MGDNKFFVTVPDMTETGNNLPHNHAAIARKLVEGIMAASLGGYEELDGLYSRYRVGGGIFWGRKMSGDIGKQTRYELIAYITAIARVLLENWPERSLEANPILMPMENTVFSFELIRAQPSYEAYVHRYYDFRPTDSSVLPREGLVHTLFHQKLLVDIWRFWPGLNTPISFEVSQELFNISQKIENGFRTLLAEVWPPSTTK